MTPTTAADRERIRNSRVSKALASSVTADAMQLKGVRREGNSWYWPAVTDKSEDEHRVDLLVGNFFCTCQGFLRWRHCEHQKGTRHMNEDPTTAVAIAEPRGMPALARQNPAALAVRLQDMRENRNLTQKFFKEVMEEGVDFGTIPGTDKPTLFKAGAESLCEFYGYAPTYSTSETSDLNTGFLRVVVTCTLLQRGTNDVIAQGIGECNTREAKYFYRWMPEWELQKVPELWEVRNTFKREEFEYTPKRGPNAGKKQKSAKYRVENDDLFTLWNTVLKMAKKRAHVDATLSATRSSGLFSQGQKALEDWIEAEYEDITEREADAPAGPSAEPKRAAEGTIGMPEYTTLSDYWDNINSFKGTDAIKEVAAAIVAVVPYIDNGKGGCNFMALKTEHYEGVLSMLREADERKPAAKQPTLG